MIHGIARKYADLLIKEDLEHFLSLLLKEYSLAEVARKCNLTRRTIYKLRRTRDPHFETKIKILEVSIKEKPSETLSLLLEKSKEKTVDILMSYFSHLYSKAVDERQDPTVFDKSLREFLEVRKEHFGLISDKVDDEVNTMLRFLEEIATERGIESPQEDIQTTKPEYLLNTIPLIVKSLYSAEEIPDNLAKTYSVPTEWTRVIFATLRDIAFKEKTEIHEEIVPGPLVTRTNVLTQEFASTSIGKSAATLPFVI